MGLRNIDERCRQIDVQGAHKTDRTLIRTGFAALLAILATSYGCNRSCQNAKVDIAKATRLVTSD